MTGGPATVISNLTQLAVPRSTLAEGPCWDAAADALYWTDIPANRVHCLAGGHHRCWEIGKPVGAVASRANGGLVLAARDGFLALDPATGTLTMLAAVEADITGNRMNDGACDRTGRFFAGTMASDEAPGAGALYRLDRDHRVTQVMTGLSISNGIGWSPDEQLMYYIDSPTHRVDVFDYDPGTAAFGNRRTFASAGAGEVVPDGLTVDSEGGVWVALWGGGQVRRYAPDGTPMLIVDLPAANVTSCTFGGPSLRTLYITTAAGPGSSGGALFACRSAVTGLPENPFRG